MSATCTISVETLTNGSSEFDLLEPIREVRSTIVTSLSSEEMLQEASTEEKGLETGRRDITGTVIMVDFAFTGFLQSTILESHCLNHSNQFDLHP